MPKIITGILALLALLATTGLVRAVDADAPKAREAYMPGLGDLMTAGVQPRHTKLWFAGRQRNWPLASYELSELKETFGDVKRYRPRWKGEDIAALIDRETKGPLADIEKAITDQNEASFIQAYNALSQGCNACHQATGHPYLVIRAPAHSPFPDQDFRPKEH